MAQTHNFLKDFSAKEAHYLQVTRKPGWDIRDNHNGK